MAFPKLENIEPRYKKFYVVTVALLVVAAVAFIVGSITMIAAGRQNPPMEMVSARYGSFPILMLCTGPKDRRSIVAGSIRGMSNVVNMTTEKSDDLQGVNLIRNRKGSCVAADLRGFGPAKRFNITKFQSASVVFGMQVPKLEAPPKEKEKRLILKYKSDLKAKPVNLGFLAYDRQQMFVLRKMIRGWTLGYTTDKEEAFSLRSLGNDNPKTKMGAKHVFAPSTRGVSCGTVVIKVFDPTVIEQLKVGIVPQLLLVLSSAGSFASLATIIIGVLFVKKYTRGDFAVAYDTYTLFGRQVEQPVEMRDVPEVKELLLAEYSEDYPREQIGGQGLGTQNRSYGEQLGGQGRFASQQSQEEESQEEDGGYLGAMYDMVFGSEQEREPPPPPRPRERPGYQRA